MRYALSLPGWVIALAVSGLGVACRAADPAVDSAGSTVPVAAAGGGAACGPGRAGCPCDGAGASAECGSTVGHYGDYVTCAMGRSYCQDGKWTACLDTTLVTKSLGKTTIGSGGLRVLSSPLPCQDACDPYMCNLLGSSAADVDAAGVTAAADGSVTLAPSSTAPPCTGLQCQVAQDCPPGTTTTLTGTVHDPAGVNPVYNAFVYVPVDPSGQLPPFTAGPTCDTCSGAAIQAVSIAQTAFDGTFVLSNVPSTDVAPGSQIPLVVQVGEWRREVMLTSVPKCQATAIDPDSSRLPRHRFDGFGSQADLPNMAIATGTSDAIECLLLKIGIDPREFQVPGTGASRIDFYDANGLDFNAPAGATKPVAPGLDVLASNLNQYDVVILPCEGNAEAGNEQLADQFSAYANAGGRLFTTHYGYTWLATPNTGSSPPVASPTNPATGKANPFYSVASWELNAAQYDTPVTAAVDTTLPGPQPFPKGDAFSRWLNAVGAASSAMGTSSLLEIDQARRDVASVNPGATRWLHNTASPFEPFYLSFDTPLTTAGDAGAGSCGRVGFADFHVSGTSLVDQGARGACTSNADCGFTATCQTSMEGTCGPVACQSVGDCLDETYQCLGAQTGHCVPQPCQRDSQCASGVCQSGVCACTSNSECSSGVCSGGSCQASSLGCDVATPCGSVEQCSGSQAGHCQKSCQQDSDCSGGPLCMGGVCQGCLSDSNCGTKSVCVGAGASTCSASSTSFPLACRQGPLTPQEDALEFMLFDVTACITPAPPPQGTTTPPPTYTAGTFTEDFTSTCPIGTRVVWRELDWQASIPAGASIVFSAQTTDQPADGGLPDYSMVQVVPLATATASTSPPGDAVLLDVGLVDAGAGAFGTATPPVSSRNDLRLTVTLNPTRDQLSAPTLLGWQIKSDCIPSE